MIFKAVHVVGCVMKLNKFIFHLFDDSRIIILVLLLLLLLLYDIMSYIVCFM